jgi:DNA polymerase-4
LRHAWCCGILDFVGFLQQHLANRRRKSSGSETTFARDLIAAEEIEAGVVARADEVWAWRENVNAFGRTVTVKVEFADFQIVTRSRSFPSAIARCETLRQTSVALVRTVLPTTKGIRLLGVTVSNFHRDADTEALPLFGAYRD